MYCTHRFTPIQLMKAAQERNGLLRGAFINKVAQYKPEQLIFLDEAAKDERTLSRAYGYSFTNARAYKKFVFIRGQRYTILPALSLDGVIALDVMEGSCTKARFREFILLRVVRLVLISLVQSFSLQCTIYWY